jgi:AcrR family transcriptional regulator
MSRLTRACDRATSWDEIARRAGVGVGTVYRHFPTLDDLLPACGAVVMQTLALPHSDDIAAVFDGATSLDERIERLVGLVFAVYARGGPFIENVRRERASLPQLDRWHTHIEDTLDALAREALRPAGPDKQTFDVARADRHVHVASLPRAIPRRAGSRRGSPDVFSTRRVRVYYAACAPLVASADSSPSLAATGSTLSSIRKSKSPAGR